MRITHTDGPLKDKTYDYHPTTTTHSTPTGHYTIDNNTSTWLKRGRGGKIATIAIPEKRSHSDLSPPE